MVRYQARMIALHGKAMPLLPETLPGEKLLMKIWETLVDNGVGGLLRPWQIKREGKAWAEVRSHELRMLAQAKREAADIKAGRRSLDEKGRLIEVEAEPPALPTETIPLLQDLREALERRDVDRAVNIATIVVKAEEEAKRLGDVPVSDKPVDPDWFARWRVNAEDVRDEEMQSLWARILAGEVREPGSYSLHTVRFHASTVKGGRCADREDRTIYNWPIYNSRPGA